jgi:hypothetical protein
MRDRVSVSNAITPRLLSVKNAASYLPSTTWFVEELIRTGKLRITIIADSRLIDIHYLDAWVDGHTGAANTRKAFCSGPTPRQEAMEILTPEEVAKRLKVKVPWVYEKRRQRTKNPFLVCHSVATFVLTGTPS